MSITELNRRAIVGALATAPAMALPVAAHPAVASPPCPDPIFAAIERHKAAVLAYAETCCRTDEVLARKEGRAVTGEDEAAYEASDREEIEALASLVATPPTSKAGVLAGLEYLAGLHRVCYDGGDAFATFAKTLSRSPVFTV